MLNIFNKVFSTLSLLFCILSSCKKPSGNFTNDPIKVNDTPLFSISKDPKTNISKTNDKEPHLIANSQKKTKEINQSSNKASQTPISNPPIKKPKKQIKKRKHRKRKRKKKTKSTKHNKKRILHFQKILYFDTH